MRYNTFFKIIIAAGMAILLSACGGSYSCSSADVRDTVKSIFTEDTKSEKLKIAFEDLEVADVATLSVDESTGNCSCSAKLIFPGKRNNYELDFEFDVQTVNDGESFQIAYNQHVAGKFKAEVAMFGLGLPFGEHF